MGLSFSSGKQNLLQIIQNVYNELSLGTSAPTQIIGNSDQQVTQLLALARREAMDFYNAGFGPGGWQALRQQSLFSINSVSGLTGTFTKGSAVVTGITPNTTGITTAMLPYATTYVAADTTILSVNSASQITMSAPALASASASFFCGQVAYALPSDFASFMTQTFWDRGFRWQLLGPLNAQEWQVLKSGISPTGPRRRFRIMNNMFTIDPVPGFSSSDNGSTEVFEYYSNAWCQSVSGTLQTNWLADTDQYCLDDDCLTLGVIWRYLRAKRLSYDEEKRSYDLLVQLTMARDGGSRNLPLNASASGIRLLNAENLPDTGYGS